MKLWGGRFTEETDKLVEKFNASFSFDQKLYKYDIQGSIIQAKMLARSNIISDEESELIVEGLKKIKMNIENQGFANKSEDEDIHTYIERNLIEIVGPAGGKLHTARSRNDQVALDMRLYLRDEIENIMELMLLQLKTFLELAEKYRKVILPGYTHLQKAQPVTFGHHLLAYYFKFKRDYERLKDNLKRVNILPLGSGALAGTTFNIDRKWVADQLGFSEVCQNSIDGVSDRDYLLEFSAIAAAVMMHFSRLGEELILWSSNEFSYIELSDAYTTGSSIMPQKKNPDVAELIRGKTGRVYGHLIQLLTMMKGLPLAYNKDMQEDKEGIFDTVETLKIILKIVPEMLKTMKVNRENMLKQTKKGYTNATELANYLVKKELPFRKAHAVVGKAVLYALEKNIELQDIKLEEWKELFPEYENIFTSDLSENLEINYCVENANSIGGPAPAETLRVVQNEYKWINIFLHS